MKIHSLGAEMFHADGQTGNFANAPKTIAWFPTSSFFNPQRWVVYANWAKPTSTQRKPYCLSGLCCKASSTVH